MATFVSSKFQANNNNNNNNNTPHDNNNNNNKPSSSASSSASAFDMQQMNYNREMDSTLTLQPLALHEAARALDDAALMLRSANTTKMGAVLRGVLKDARAAASALARDAAVLRDQEAELNAKNSADSLAANIGGLAQREIEATRKITGEGKNQQRLSVKGKNAGDISTLATDVETKEQVQEAITVVETLAQEVVQALDDISPGDIDTLAVLVVSAAKAVSIAVGSLSGTLRLMADEEDGGASRGSFRASSLRSDGYEIIGEDGNPVALNRDGINSNASPVVVGLAKSVKQKVKAKWEKWPVLLSIVVMPVCALWSIPLMWMSTAPLLTLMSVEWYWPIVSVRLREGSTWAVNMVVGTYVFVSTTWRFWWALTWAWVRAFFGSAKWW